MLLLLSPVLLAGNTARELLDSARKQQSELVSRYGLAEMPFWQQACDAELSDLQLQAFKQCLIIEAPFANAYSLAHGVVVLTTGLLRQINNADQLAHVLAHEHAHLTLGHHQQAQALINDPPVLFTKSRIKKFYRAIEREADQVANEQLISHQRDALQIHHYLIRLEHTLDEQSTDHDKINQRIQRTGLPAEVIDPAWQQAGRMLSRESDDFSPEPLRPH